MAFSEEYFMGLAIKKARQGIGDGQAPFGCAIVKGDALLSCEHDKVWSRTDITAHAQIMAIREACKKLKSVNLMGCTLYCTCEPCDMCYSAAAWARVAKICFAATSDDAIKAGFSDRKITEAQLNKLQDLDIEIRSGLMSDEGRVLLEQYREIVGDRIY